MSTQQRRQAIEQLLQDVNAIVATGVDRDALVRIAALVDRLAERRDLFNFEVFPAPEAGSGSVATRYRLNDDGDASPTLYLNAMLPGRDTLPHNHETWAVIAAVEGPELNRIYKRTDDGTSKVRASLELERELTVAPRAPAGFLGDDIHSILVTGQAPTLHFHLYGRPLESLDGRYGVKPDGSILNYNANLMAPSTPGYDR